MDIIKKVTGKAEKKEAEQKKKKKPYHGLGNTRGGGSTDADQTIADLEYEEGKE